MRVNLKEMTMVRPSKDTPKMALWLSDLDLLVPCTHLPVVYFYKQNGSSDFFDVKVLKEALANVLVPFYPMAGRLGTDEKGRMEIHCNGEGVHFAEAESDVTIEEYGDFTPREEMMELVPKVDCSGNISSYPLLLVQVTVFKCGGVCLGVAYHHALADGGSAIHFFNSWSDLARGVPLNTSPFIHRTLLRPRDPPIPTFHHSEYDPPPPMNAFQEPQNFQCATRPTTTKIITISLDQINTLKAKSWASEPTSKPTTYETLAAHIWSCMCQVRCLDDNQPTRLFTVTDGRLRLNPPLPLGFLGNVLFLTTVTCSAGQIRSNNLFKTIDWIRSALNRRDDEYLRSALDFLALQPDMAALKRGAHTSKCPNAKIVSWTKLPIRDADFGWGRPIFMGPAKVLFEGTAFILPSSLGDNSLNVIICLETTQMELFEKCFYDCFENLTKPNSQTGQTINHRRRGSDQGVKPQNSMNLIEPSLTKRIGELVSTGPNLTETTCFLKKKKMIKSNL